MVQRGKKFCLNSEELPTYSALSRTVQCSNPAALGKQGVRGRVRISTYTVTKLVKGKLVESEVGSSL